MLPAKDTPLLISENSIHNKESRLKLTEFLFEKYKVPAIFFCKDSVLSAFACGRSTALVLDSGSDTTTATPVHDGYALQKCLLRQQIGGNTLTRKFGEWLSKEQKKEILPRFALKVKHENIDGQDSYTRTPVDCAGVDPEYYKWNQF
jgi:actin-related protein